MTFLKISCQYLYLRKVKYSKMCIFAVINMKRVKEAKSRQIQTIMSCVAILLVIFFILAVVFAIIHPEGFDPIKYWGFYYWHEIFRNVIWRNAYLVIQDKHFAK